jgi:O-antigen ligase
VPCILLLALAPFASLSRAAVIIGAGSIVTAIVIVVTFGKRVKARVLLVIAGMLLGSLVLGTALEWAPLFKRFEQEPADSGRVGIWRNTWEIFKDYPVYGTGPGTFKAVYLLYRPAITDQWQAYAHNDWLELLATFGSVGSVLVLGALVMALAHPWFGSRIRTSTAFIPLLCLGLVNCLVFAAVDFPFVIYSILFTFLVVCALLTSMSQRGE